MINKLIVLVFAFLIWHGSQIFLSSDGLAGEGIVDIVHTSYPFNTINELFRTNYRFAQFNFILTSLLIDLNVIYIVKKFLYTQDIRTIVIMLGGFIMRQICQYLNRLPVPNNMVWFYPGFPSILVTYYTENDFFFSGHTYVSLCAGIEIMRNKSILSKLYGLFFIVYEIMLVLSIHGHYFMDVYGAIATYFMMNYFYDLINSMLQ